MTGEKHHDQNPNLAQVGVVQALGQFECSPYCQLAQPRLQSNDRFWRKADIAALRQTLRLF
jgi:hypothetical protein